MDVRNAIQKPLFIEMIHNISFNNFVNNGACSHIIYFRHTLSVYSVIVIILLKFYLRSNIQVTH